MKLYKHKIQPDWWTKTLTGLILGFTFALAVSVIVFFLGLSSIDRSNLSQLSMWLIPWIWLFMFFLAYFLPKGWHSLMLFSVANLLAYALVFWLRSQ